MEAAVEPARAECFRLPLPRPRLRPPVRLPMRPPTPPLRSDSELAGMAAHMAQLNLFVMEVGFY